MIIVNKTKQNSLLQVCPSLHVFSSPSLCLSPSLPDVLISLWTVCTWIPPLLLIYLSFSGSFFPRVRFLSGYRFPSFCICLSVPLFMFPSLSVSLFQVLFPSPVRPPFSLRLSLCTPLSSEVCFFPSSSLSFAWEKYMQNMYAMTN